MDERECECVQACLIPEYAVGIRSYGRWDLAQELNISTCVAQAIHGAKIGAWEYRTLMPGEERPRGWFVVYECETHRLIEHTYWERLI